MLHPHIERRLVDSTTGFGLFATHPIPRGTILWARDRFDRILTDDAVRAMAPTLREIIERYSYIDGRGRRILCWDDARYQNHSCDATTVPLGATLDVAVRDVAPGDHVTCDYGLLNLTGAFACHCGRDDCRGTISSALTERFVAWWDRCAEAAFAAACTVPQPLLPFALFEPEDEPISEALRVGRPIPLPSTRAHLRPDSPVATAMSTRPWALR
jgi:hypothetical protein